MIFDVKQIKAISSDLRIKGEEALRALIEVPNCICSSHIS